MIMKENKQIGFIYKNNESIDKIIKDGEVVFERGFLRERTSTTLPITFGGVGKDLKDYRVYGNTYQKTTDGKNLIPNNKTGRTNQGVTFTPQEDGTYLINGQNTTNSNAIVYIYQGDFNLQAGTYYGIPTGDNNVTVTMYARFSDNTVQYIDLKEINNINKQIIYAYIYIQVRKKTSTIFNDYKVYPMLSAMPITIDDYEPYTNGASPNPDYPQEIISCGDRTKNLFDKNTTDVFSAYFEFSGDTIEYAVNNRIIYLKCKSNTVYTLTQGTSKLSSHIFQIATTDEEPALGVKVYNFVELWSSKNYTYTTNSTAKYILIRIRSGDYIDEFLSTIQVEEGNTATEYEPYGYKIPVNVNNVITNIYLDEPLRKIDEYSDYIDFKNGKVVRNIDEIVLNGTENWALTNNSFQSNECISLYTNKLASTLRTNQLYSNYFKCVLTQKNFKYNIGKIFTSSANQLYVNMDKSLISSVEDFKTWLSTHNTKVNYVLENQTEESITLPNISTIDGNNTLNIETEITPSQVYIKFKSNV